MSISIAAKNLQNNGYQVSCFANVQEANSYLSQSITGQTVGIGGTKTVEQMGLYPYLAERNTVYWHWRPQPQMDTPQIMALAAGADVYITSANALSLTGQIVNIDGTCNRLSAMLYGHKKVYIIVGRNKLAEDLDAAISRARNVAAPKNAQRLRTDTPCAKKADRCYDCSSPARICRALGVLWKKPGGCEFEVVIIDEDLGY